MNKHIYILRCPDGRGLVYTSLSEAVNACQTEGYLACEDYQIERHGYDPVNCTDLGIDTLYNVYGEVERCMNTAMTHTDALIAAVALIRGECNKHTICKECPLNGIICYSPVKNPSEWPAEKIGVEDGE